MGTEIALRLADGKALLKVPDAPAPLEAASVHTIATLLAHQPPAAGELEEAIARIEDGLMPMVRQLPRGAELVTAEPAIRAVAEAAGLSGGEIRLETSTVEDLFNQLADIAWGMPAGRYGLPTDRDFVAVLLVLRELLHHGGFAAVRVCPSTDALAT